MITQLKRMRTLALSCVLAVLAAFVLPSSARAVGDQDDVHESTGPTPQVRLPPPGQNGFPFMSTTLDLGRFGYQEQEFLISGTATAYVPTAPFGADGRWAVAPAPEGAAPYTV